MFPYSLIVPLSIALAIRRNATLKNLSNIDIELVNYASAVILLAIKFMRFRRLHGSRNKSFLAVEKFPIPPRGTLYRDGGLMRVKVIDLWGGISSACVGWLFVNDASR